MDDGECGYITKLKKPLQVENTIFIDIGIILDIPLLIGFLNFKKSNCLVPN